MWKERKIEVTASGLPMILATVEVASERMEEVSTPSRLTLVDRFRQGIFALSLFALLCKTLVASLVSLSLFLLSTYSGSLGIESFCPKCPLGVFVNTSERRLRKYKICYKYMVIVFEHIIIHDNFYFSSK